MNTSDRCACYPITQCFDIYEAYLWFCLYCLYGNTILTKRGKSIFNLVNRDEGIVLQLTSSCCVSHSQLDHVSQDIIISYPHPLYYWHYIHANSDNKISSSQITSLLLENTL